MGIPLLGSFLFCVHFTSLYATIFLFSLTFARQTVSVPTFTVLHLALLARKRN